MKKALIIRHAHREKMPSELGQNVDGFQENLVPVTEEGRLAARNVGELISAQYENQFKMIFLGKIRPDTPVT